MTSEELQQLNNKLDEIIGTLGFLNSRIDFLEQDFDQIKEGINTVGEVVSKSCAEMLKPVTKQTAWVKESL
jgi:prefoldin subunit 5